MYMHGSGSMSQMTFSASEVQALSPVPSQEKENHSPLRGNAFGKLFRKALRKSARLDAASSSSSSSPPPFPVESGSSLQLSHVTVVVPPEESCLSYPGHRLSSVPISGQGGGGIVLAARSGCGSLVVVAVDAADAVAQSKSGGDGGKAETRVPTTTTTTTSDAVARHLKKEDRGVSSSSSSSSRRSSSSLSSKFDRSAASLKSVVSSSLLLSARSHMSSLLSSLSSSSSSLLAMGSAPSGPYVGPFDLPFNPRVLSVGSFFPAAVRFKLLAAPFYSLCSSEQANTTLDLPSLCSLFLRNHNGLSSSSSSMSSPRFAVLDFYVSRTRSSDPVIAVDP